MNETSTKEQLERDLFVPEYANKDELVNKGEVFAIIGIDPEVMNREKKPQIEYTLLMQDGETMKMRHGHSDARLEEASRIIEYLKLHPEGVRGVQLKTNVSNERTYYRFRFA
jgi:hypothetical protein